jgi:hypothetical protein
MRNRTGREHTMKRLVVIAVLAAVAALGVAPSVANAGGVSVARWSYMPKPARWSPMPARPARWSPAWRYEIVPGTESIVAPVHRLQWKTARNVSLGQRLVLQSSAR